LIDDERVRRVFEDIAKEEKIHFGGFLTLLKSIDPEQVEQLICSLWTRYLSPTCCS
jgi:rubrerythrin